jgi:deoxyribonuclease IV
MLIGLLINLTYKRKSLRSIGLHLRFAHSFVKMIDKAIALNMPIFQSFLMQKNDAHMGIYDKSDMRKFILTKRQHFNHLYVHGSYWINLASVRNTNHYCLRREIDLAKKLEFTHMILHAGSAKGAGHRHEGIYAMARVFNTLFKYESELKFILENTAHGNLTVGGDFEDFKLLLSLLDHPEKLLFCIDNTHAHSFGYDVMSPEGRESFLHTVDSTVGLDKIALLHINDTHQLMGSKMDRHEILGAGLLGDDAIRAFALHEKLAHIPMILELPELAQEIEIEILEKVRKWHEII